MSLFHYPRGDVFCLGLNFDISKLVYFRTFSVVPCARNLNFSPQGQRVIYLELTEWTAIDK